MDFLLELYWGELLPTIRFAELDVYKRQVDLV